MGSSERGGGHGSGASHPSSTQAREFRLQLDAYKRKVMEQQNEIRARQIRQNIVQERATLLESSLNSALDSLKHHKHTRADLEAKLEKQVQVVQRKDQQIAELKDQLKDLGTKLSLLHSEEGGEFGGC